VNGISPVRQAWRTSSNSLSNVSGSTGAVWGVGEVDSYDMILARSRAGGISLSECWCVGGKGAGRGYI
jgi:hypothetical protein